MPFDGTLSPTTEVLISARRKVKDGWCQGAGRRRGSVCAAIALFDAMPNWTVQEATLGIFCRAIGSAFIGDWNDAPGRTKEDVLAAYDRAIALSLTQ